MVNPDHDVRVVISLTTVPGRYDKLLNTLSYLKQQDYPVSAIYLTIPEVSKRFNTAYPEPPQAIKDLVTVVRIQKDYGPICKIIGALLNEPDPNTLIVTCDDDIVYSPNLVSSLVRESKKHPNAAIGGSGLFLSGGLSFYSYHCHSVYHRNFMLDFHVPDHGRDVEILCGFSGVLYPRSAFPEAETEEDLYELLNYTNYSKDIFLNDDVLLSAWMSYQGCRRVVVKDTPLADEYRLLAGNTQPDHDKLALSNNMWSFVQRLRISYMQCLEFKLFKEQLRCSGIETVGVKIIVITVIIVILILLVWVLCYCYSNYWSLPQKSGSDDLASMLDMGYSGMGSSLRY